jgi:hypothetical protein
MDNSPVLTHYEIGCDCAQLERINRFNLSFNT